MRDIDRRPLGDISGYLGPLQLDGAFRRAGLVRAPRPDTIKPGEYVIADHFHGLVSTQDELHNVYTLFTNHSRN